MNYDQNVLEAVQTIKDLGTATLENMNPVFASADHRYDNFQNDIAQLGDQVKFQKIGRATVVDGPSVATQPAVERTFTLTCDTMKNASQSYSQQQLLFNIEPYQWEKSWIKQAIESLANQIEIKVSADFAIYPQRFYGDGRTPLTDYLGLSRILTRYRNWGSVAGEAKMFLPDFVQDSIWNSGLNQFAIDRNNSTAQSWEIANGNRCKFMISNNLYLHTAGSEGQADSTLTVSGTTKNSAGQITHISFTGTSASNDAASIKKGDRIQITTAGTSLLNFTSYNRSINPIQCMAAADAAAISGTVTVQLATPLYPGKSLSDALSISTDIVAGMTANVADSHYAACVYTGSAHMVANPQMGELSPYVTNWEAAKDTGVAIRVAYGSSITDAVQLLRLDTLAGSAMNADQSMTILIPESQGY